MTRIWPYSTRVALQQPAHLPTARQERVQRNNTTLRIPTNSQGAHDSYGGGQSQNPASYGGGQAANRFGTAVDVSTQSMSRGKSGYDDDDGYDPYL
jgi:hypothetical protein